MSAAHATGAACVPLVERVGYGRRAPGLIPTGEVEVISARCFAWFALELARPVPSELELERRPWAVPAALEVDAFPVAGGCVILCAPADSRAMLERLALAGMPGRVVEL